MNNEFKRIYSGIWERQLDPRYPYGQPSLAHAVARSAVTEALRAREEVTVRDDAKILMLINIRTLVVLPQLINGASPEEVLRQTSSDVGKILDAAVEKSRDGEVSSAAVIRGLGEVLDYLNLKDARIWSESSRQEGA